MNSHHHVDLIDTTEMYLRTIYELGEEGIPPLRARIAERLGQSGPTVSQTVARMERDGLVHVESDRQLALSEAGRRNARSVMRKHRLAECLLADVIGLEWDQLHIEACRWEHVMSEAVERRIVALLEGPLVCPHGNPIPALEELGVVRPEPAESSKATENAILSTLSASLRENVTPVSIIRISEHLQADDGLMRLLVVAGVVPGHTVIVRRVEQGAEVFASLPALGADGTVLPNEVADGIFVTVLSSSTQAAGADADPMVIACSTANAASTANAGSLAVERDAS